MALMIAALYAVTAAHGASVAVPPDAPCFAPGLPIYQTIYWSGYPFGAFIIWRPIRSGRWHRRSAAVLYRLATLGNAIGLILGRRVIGAGGLAAFSCND